ncbi:MAG: hypothetical protein ACFB4J_02805 [Elainellaceae cyanobacterium]
MATSNPNPSRPNPQPTLESLQERQANLKLTVDELQTKLAQTRGLIQTLLLGLVVATLVGLGVAGWLAYRLLVQEQIAQRDLEQAATSATEVQEQLEAMEERLQAQKRQLQTLREEVPAELETLTDAVQANQRQLQLLRERIQSSSLLEERQSEPEDESSSPSSDRQSSTEDESESAASTRR